MNPLQQSTENSFDQAKHDRWLRERHENKDLNGLLEAALLLNTLYHLERTKSTWAIREAATNLCNQFNQDT